MNRGFPRPRLRAAWLVVALATVTSSVVAMEDASAAGLTAHPGGLASSDDVRSAEGSDQEPSDEKPETPTAASEDTGTIVFALALAVIGGGTLALIWRTSRKLDDP